MDARIEPRADIRAEDMPEQKEPPFQIYLFICPTPGCGNYYAAPRFIPGDSMLDQVQMRRGDQGPTETRTRRDCPDCWVRNSIRVPRIAHMVTSIVVYDDVEEAVHKIQERNRAGDVSNDGAG